MSKVGTAWKALPVSAVAALYINGIQRFVRQNLIAFFGAGTGFAVSDSLGWREFGLGAGLVLLIGLLIAVIYHRRFRYFVDDNSVRVRKGLFEQQELKVRFERVQNVGFSQPVYLRPLGLVRVTLETPGAAQTEVSLPGIASAEAAALRDLVSGAYRSRPASDDGDESVVESKPAEPDRPAQFQASAADLFRYGMSSNQIWILLALLGAPASNWVESRLSNWLEQLKSADFLDMQMLSSAPLLIALLVGLLILATALMLMAVSGLLAIVRFHGYRLLLDTDRFKARFGLLDVREKTLRVSKLHSIEIAQTAIGRVLGQWYAVGHQTGANPLNQERRFLIPGIDDKRVTQVVSVLRDNDWQMPDWQGIHPRFRSLLWIRTSAVLVAAAVALWQLLPGNPVWPSAAILAVNVVVLACVHLRWRRWAYALDDRRLRIRSGLVGQTILEFDLARCQQVRITASPYQRRHRLASLNIRLPHGEQAIPWLPRDVADRIANLLLYRAETSTEHGL
ncbi:MAG: PH domain-containing protein [Wenzhouxiangellaceae bacterium]